MIKNIQEICLDFYNNRTEETFKTVVKRLKPGIANHLLKIEKDYETRNFLMNITFAKMWTEIDKYNPKKGNFSTWIYKIARNEALQHKRYTNRHSSFDSLSEAGSGALLNNSAIIEMPVEFFDEVNENDVMNDLYTEVINSIYEISDNSNKAMYKDILIMKIIERKKYKDIAKEFGIPENTAKARVLNGKKLIGKIIEKRKPELVSAFRKSIKQ